MTRPHTTHHESCGCCEAERDALKAQVARLREILRDALPLSNGAAKDCRDDGFPKLADKHEAISERISHALASTPAQSLAAHDAEVRAKALRLSLWAHEASDFLDELWQEFPTESATWYGANVLLNEYKDIKALAERAPEVER